MIEWERIGKTLLLYRRTLFAHASYKVPYTLHPIPHPHSAIENPKIKSKRRRVPTLTVSFPTSLSYHLRLESSWYSFILFILISYSSSSSSITQTLLVGLNQSIIRKSSYPLTHFATLVSYPLQNNRIPATLAIYSSQLGNALKKYQNIRIHSKKYLEA